MLAIMETRGSIDAAMHRAGLDFRARVLASPAHVTLLLGALGRPAGTCAVAVLGLGRSLKDFARTGWCGKPIAQEAAAGILITALGILAKSGAALKAAPAVKAKAPRRLFRSVGWCGEFDPLDGACDPAPELGSGGRKPPAP
jgi:hypothetical protein